MKNFSKVAEGVDVEPLRVQVAVRPELWNTHPQRTSVESPHYGVDDIWVRYRALEDLKERHHFREPHFAVFYPAWHALPALHPIVFALMHKVKAVYLGGILITRIPPGGRVKPHHDRGSWHAEYLNMKVYVPIQSNEHCVNYCEDETEVMRPGTVYHFDNLRMHSVENNGETARITAIVCMRVEA